MENVEELKANYTVMNRNVTQLRTLYRQTR